MLSNLPPNEKITLLIMINQKLVSGTLPADWKHSYIVPIPKNSGPTNIVSSYRPIALSCTPQITERIES